MEGEVAVCNASIVKKTRQLESATALLCACEHPHSPLSVAPCASWRPTFQRITQASFMQSIRNLDGRSISSTRSRCA
jgi:hypothetical protein